jgi:hypothetical protein
MRSAFCMMVMAIAALPLMDKGVHAAEANFDLSDFFLNLF